MSARTRRRRPARTVSRRAGFVALVGAGPGDPDLLTVRARTLLAQADLVLHDGLVPEAIVRLAPRGARVVSVARRVGPKTLTQARVNRMLIDAARRGRRVVRLKSGDPFVFARGGEECAALAAAGVAFEIVPGVTSAIAAPALAGIPLTLRDVSAAFVVVSGHAPEAYGPVLSSLAPGSATVVILMGLGHRRDLAACLKRAGWRAETPAAIVTHASRPLQRVWIGTLADLDRAPLFDPKKHPGVIVVGDVVAFAHAYGTHVFSQAENVG